MMRDHHFTSTYLVLPGGKFIPTACWSTRTGKTFSSRSCLPPLPWERKILGKHQKLFGNHSQVDFKSLLGWGLHQGWTILSMRKFSSIFNLNIPWCNLRSFPHCREKFSISADTKNIPNFPKIPGVPGVRIWGLKPSKYLQILCCLHLAAVAKNKQ